MEPFSQWLASFNWLNERGLSCVISADLDGLSCGLFQQEHLGWRVVGTYDGSELALWERPNAIDWASTVFLDVEILRPDARCIGNHLLASDAEDVERLRAAYPHCANPNQWRGINVEESFQQKYPFSTLPLVIAAHALREAGFRLSSEWLALMLQTDSSFTNAAQYQANALNWLEIMGMGDDNSPIHKLCGTLRRLPAQLALRLVENVQGWASNAGYGVKQRACRFSPSNPTHLERAKLLLDRVRTETKCETSIPLDQRPTRIETFAVAKLPIHTKGRRRTSFATTTEQRAISLAVTGRTNEGLSYTLPNPQSAVALFR